MPESINEAIVLKEEGNSHYKDGDWVTAITCYTKALSLSKEENFDKAIILKNRAAGYLKLDDHEKALKDCNEALDITPNDVKALFRRMQALESLERVEEAYRDARAIHNLEPKNQAVQPVLKRLHAHMQDLVNRRSQTVTKVQTMFQFAFDTESDLEKRKNAVSNLVILAKERAGADLMYENGIIGNIVKLLKANTNKDIRLSCMRIIGELCKNNQKRTKEILREVGLPWLIDQLNSDVETVVAAAQYAIQVIINTLSGMNIKEGVKPDKNLLQEHQKELDSIMSFLMVSTTSRTLSGLARDAVLEIIIQNVDWTALDWSLKFVEKKGLSRILEVASEMEDYKYESSMRITESTATIVSVALGKLYENMYYDEAKKIFTTEVEEFVKDLLKGPDVESKVRVTAAITTMLKGPLDVGNTMVGREGVLEMMLVMAKSEDLVQQKVAAEALIAASSKKDKVKSILSLGTNILKELYQSKSDEVKVRALVGLCKLGGSGGTDAAMRPFSEGSSLKLAEACRRFLISPSKDRSMKKWAVEGLSYLTLDADVKEKLIEDSTSLQAMLHVAKSGDQSVIYGCITTFVNLTNSYDKQELIPEMIELAKFAKQHIPEEHELDDPDFVQKRIKILAEEGITSALVVLAKSESDNCKELISRVFNAICEEPSLRGIVVQQGGVKALASMAVSGTNKGKKQAAQALARIGITMNPEQAFPGQRAMEAVRPLIALLHPDCSGLENFESLMALTNLAGISEPVRQRIIAEQGFSAIDHYLYEEHDMLRRAACQCMTNMVLSPDVMRYFEGKNDRVKLLVLLCQEEDVELVKACGGALAILTNSKRCAKKFVEVSSWLDSLHYLVVSENIDLQHRGVCIAANLMASCKEVAHNLIETDIMEILMAVSKLPPESEQRKKVIGLAEEALKFAADWKLIRPSKEGGEEEGEGDSDVD